VRGGLHHQRRAEVPPKAVSPQVKLEEICQRMVDERIHRVLVMEGSRVRGIVTSFDIVSLMAGRGTSRPARHKKEVG
jgi:CBS domain-containing protein